MTDQQQLERTEARLRAAVAHRVEAVRPADEPASLAAIERRLAAARRGRRLRRPALAGLAVAALVAVVLGLTAVLDDGSSDRLRTTGPGTTTTTLPATTSTTPAPPEVGAPDDAVWPPPGHEPFADPVAATRSFVEEYLGAPDPPLSAFRPGHADEGEVDVYLVGEGRSVRRDRVVGTVTLRQVGGAWMVVGARSADIVVDHPKPLDTVASPVVSDGRSQGYEGTIFVTVVQRGATPREPLGEAVGIAGSYEGLAPFHLEAALDRAPSQPVGSLLFATDTGCGECNTSFAVVPIRFAPVRGSDQPAPGVPPPPRRYVMLREGRVVVVDDGVERSAPMRDGVRDVRVALAPDGTTAYVETWTTDSTQRTEIQEWSLSGDPAPTGRVVLPGGTFPAVSPDGRWLAYARSGEESHLLTVRGVHTGAERVWAFPADHELQSLVWAPDSRRLALMDLYGGEGGAIVFDTAEPPGPVAPRPTLPGTITLASWRGGVGTLLGWRFGPHVEGSPDPGPSSELVEVDAATGAVLGVLFVVPTTDPVVDPDASGHHFLVVTRYDELYRWTGERLVLLHRGVSAAAW